MDKVDALITALDQPEFRDVEKAAMALGNSHSRKAVTPLINVLAKARTFEDEGPQPETAGDRTTDESAVIARAAMAALGCLQDARAVPALLDALDDPRHGVAIAAATALGDIGDTRAVEPLIEVLETATIPEDILPIDTIAYERALAAAKALGRLGDHRAIGPLLSALGDTSRISNFAAEEVARALLALGHTQVAETLVAWLDDPEWERRERAEVILDYLVDPAVADALLAALQDPTLDARFEALEALGKQKDPRAVDVFLRELDETGDSWSRGRIAYHLGSLGDERAVGPLLRSLNGPDIENDDWRRYRLRAVEALGYIGSPKAVEPLLGLMDSLDPYESEVFNEALDGIAVALSEKAAEMGPEETPLPDIQRALSLLEGRPQATRQDQDS